MTTKLTRPGLYSDIPMKDYVGDPLPEPSMSKGVTHTLIERTPMHAHHEHPRLGGHSGSSSPRAELGSAVHLMVLGAENRIVWIEADAYRSKDAKAARDAALNDGNIPMLIKYKQIAADMAGPAINLLKAEFGDGLKEQTAVARYGGVWLKCRPDFVAGAWVDLKTVKDASQRRWVKSTMYGTGYDIQGANYSICAEELSGGQVVPVVFLLSELDAPFACSLVEMSDDALDLGKRKIDYAAPIWRRCLDSGEFPGYGRERHAAYPPPWESQSMEALEDAARWAGVAVNDKGEVIADG